MEPVYLIPVTKEQFEKHFKKLARKWRKETEKNCSMTQINNHPAYLQIMEMGEPALPLIFSELKLSPDWWFAALKQITGEDPVPPEDRGHLTSMTNTWLAWGREKGLV